MTSAEFDAAVTAVNSFKKMPSQDDALLVCTPASLTDNEFAS